MNQSRDQLTDYFTSELAELRTDAIEFARNNPKLARELSLHEGKSRDPHVEMLLQSFAWMTGRLRQNLEAESQQLPAMLLQQLYPSLISSMPSMSIMECEVNGKDADFDNGYQLDGMRLFEPVHIDDKPEIQSKLAQCRFSTCHRQVLWPLKVSSVQKSPLNRDLNENIILAHPETQAILDIHIETTPKGSVNNLRLSKPLRFFINLDETSKFALYDYLAKDFVGAVVLDDKDQVVAKLSKDHLNFAGFDDEERTLPQTKQQDLGLSLLQDYMNFPEKFLFFELTGLENVQFRDSFTIKLLFDQPVPNIIPVRASTLKLNCVPIVNLFKKTTEPVQLTHRDYRYKLYPSRENYGIFEIYNIGKVYSMNRRGESRELMPYFSLDLREQTPSDYRWKVQIEASSRRNLNGTEAWLSLFNHQYDRDCPQGETIYAETLCCNRNMVERFNVGQKFLLIGSSPIESAKLLTRPTRYRGVKKNKEHLWKVLSHLSLYYSSLTDNSLATDSLHTLLDLYGDRNDPVFQQQIENIEKLSATQDVYPVLKQGWRGYYQGVHFVLKLRQRKYQGSSPIMMGAVLRQFLALFCHVNSFVRMELNVGNQMVYEWPPLSGHKNLA